MCTSCLCEGQDMPLPVRWDARKEFHGGGNGDRTVVVSQHAVLVGHDVDVGVVGHRKLPDGRPTSGGTNAGDGCIRWP